MPKAVPPKKPKHRLAIAIGIVTGIVLTIIIAASVGVGLTIYDETHTDPDAIIYNANGSITTTAKTLLKEFNDNEIRAGEIFNKKRVSFSGCVESVNDMLIFSAVQVSNCKMLSAQRIRAIFPNSAKKQLATLIKGSTATITCTIIDGGNIMGVLAKDCEVNR